MAGFSILNSFTIFDLPPGGRRNSMEELMWKVLMHLTKSGMDFLFCSCSFKENFVIWLLLTVRKGGKYSIATGPVSGFQWARISLCCEHLMWFSCTRLNIHRRTTILNQNNLGSKQSSDPRQNISPLYAIIFLIPHLLSEDFKILHLKILLRSTWGNTFKTIRIITDILVNTHK